MLKSWDFVDPKLASKIKLLQTQIASLQRQRTTLQKDFQISTQTKQKLLNFNKKNICNNQQLLQRLKDKLAQYFDKQIEINTKENINQSGNRQHVNIANNSIEFTKSFQESTVDEQKIKEKLNSTRCSIYPNGNNTNNINISNYLKKINGNKPKPKAKIYRKQRKFKQLNSKLKTQLKTQKMKTRWLSYTVQTLMQQKIALQINVQENNQLVDLYKQKMNLLSRKCLQLQQQKVQIQIKYKKQLDIIMQDYQKLKQIQEQNRQLSMERTLLLRKLQKTKNLI